MRFRGQKFLLCVSIILICSVYVFLKVLSGSDAVTGMLGAFAIFAGANAASTITGIIKKRDGDGDGDN